jgi:hypothetical protein
MELSLDDLRLYVRCPLEWFWERRAGLPRRRQVSDLVPDALRTALDFYYRGYADSLGQAVGLVWQDWCAAWGEPPLAQDLLRYATVRAGILGRTVRDNGEPYLAPKMSAFYRDQMHRAGMVDLGRRLDDFAATHGLLILDERDRPVGSALGDAFADCLVAADNARKFEEPLPAPEIVLGNCVPYQIRLSGGIQLTGTADLVWRALPRDEAGEREGGVVLEVHDYREQLWVRARLAKHDLRVIAASLAEPIAEQPVTWKRVACVIYRHWPTGTAFKCYETNVGHLYSVLNSVARGMRQQVFIPRALTGYDYCRTCAYRAPCWDDGGWENMHLTDPGTLGRGERLRAMAVQMRSAIAGNDHAARRARQALEVVEAALAEVAPDPADTRAVLGEARHTFTVMADE